MTQLAARKKQGLAKEPREVRIQERWGMEGLQVKRLLGGLTLIFCFNDHYWCRMRSWETTRYFHTVLEYWPMRTRDSQRKKDPWKGKELKKGLSEQFIFEPKTQFCLFGTRMVCANCSQQHWNGTAATLMQNTEYIKENTSHAKLSGLLLKAKLTEMDWVPGWSPFDQLQPVKYYYIKVCEALWGWSGKDILVQSGWRGSTGSFNICIKRIGARINKPIPVYLWFRLPLRLTTEALADRWGRNK